MYIVFHKNFKKQYKKFSWKVKKYFEEKLRLFEVNPFNPILNNHKLRGELKTMRSINITGDIRAIYEQPDEDRAVFMTIASHSKLYD